MSTTIKRVALVAVAALSLGVISVAPSTAASSASADFASTKNAPFVVTLADTVSGDYVYDTNTAAWDSGTAAAAVSVSQVAGPSNYVEITADSDDTRTATGTIAVQVAVTGTTLAIGTQPTSGVDTFTVNAAGTIATSEAKAAGNDAAISGAKIRIAVPAVGTYTATVSKVVTSGGISTITDQQVFTITGVTSATRGVIVLGNSTSYITDSVDAKASLAAIKAATLAADSTVLTGKSTDRVAGIRVTLKDGQPTPQGVSGKELVAVVTGAGLVGAITAGSTGARVATATTDAAGVAAFAVFGDGTAGVGTITITQGTTTVATETFTFTGTVAAIAATSKKSILSTTNSAALASAVEIKATDSAGNLVTNLDVSKFSATSSDAAVLSSTISVLQGTEAQLEAGLNNGPGYYYVSVNSGSAGTIASGSKATLTVKYTIDATTSVSASAVNFTTGGTTVYGLKLTSDVATAIAGEKVTLTLSATDKAGNPIADGTYVVLDTTTVTQNAGALTSSQTLTNTLFGTGSITFLGGVKTSTFYAPQNKVVLTGLVASSASVAVALQATAITTTVEVSNAAVDAATDAANEAAQAASDATDAALAAADAADAATTKAQEAVDAVATLSAQVSKLITALKAQITTLTNLVIKIQKKVRA